MTETFINEPIPEPTPVGRVQAAQNTWHRFFLLFLNRAESSVDVDRAAWLADIALVEYEKRWQLVPDETVKAK